MRAWNLFDLSAAKQRIQPLLEVQVFLKELGGLKRGPT